MQSVELAHGINDEHPHGLYVWQDGNTCLFLWESPNQQNNILFLPKGFTSTVVHIWHFALRIDGGGAKINTVDTILH